MIIFVLVFIILICFMIIIISTINKNNENIKSSKKSVLSHYSLNYVKKIKDSATNIISNNPDMFNNIKLGNIYRKMNPNNRKYYYQIDLYEGSETIPNGIGIYNIGDIREIVGPHAKEFKQTRELLNLINKEYS